MNIQYYCISIVRWGKLNLHFEKLIIQAMSRKINQSNSDCDLIGNAL